jgi:hypothetical protein
MTINLNIPRSWKEVTLPQLRILAEHSLAQMSREESAIALFCKLAGVTIVQKPMDQEGKLEGMLRCVDAEGNSFSIDADTMNGMCHTLDWYFDEMPCDIVCPLEGVNRWLLETKFGKYFHADSLMFGFSTTGNMEMVKGAMADLGDDRQTLTEVDAVMMHLWWRGFKQWLTGEYPDVFAGDKDDNSGGGVYVPIKIRQNIMLLLNDCHPQDNDAIENSNVHDVLSALQHQIEVAKKEEEMMKKYRS